MTFPPSDEPHAVQPPADMAAEPRVEETSVQEESSSTDQFASADRLILQDNSEAGTESSLGESSQAEPTIPAPGAAEPQLEEPPLFANVFQAPPPPPRIPHLGHVALLAAYLVLSLFVSVVILRIAVYFHLFHVTTLQAAVSDIHYAIGSEVLLYLGAFAAAYFTLPLVWHKGFFAGVQWNGASALRHRWALIGTGFLCYVLAMLNIIFIPGPTNTPIEKIFKEPGAAWLLFFFGISFAPFFEELFFRGFLLPALCTVADWTDESLFVRPDLNLKPGLRIALSAPAMALVCCVSLGVPFAIVYSIYEIVYSTGKFPALILLAAIFVGSGVYAGLQTIRSSAAEQHVRPLGPGGSPQWSITAMAVASVVTSAPFALMHAEQTGNSVDAVLLLACVSIVLCAVRLVTRSLAASVLVHSFYNFLIFSMMLLGTEGFRHLDKM